MLGRELTKQHETILRGSARAVREAMGDGDVKGEIVLVVGGAPEGSSDLKTEESASRTLEAWRAALERHGGQERRALRDAARDLGLERSELFRILGELGVLRAPRK